RDYVAALALANRFLSAWQNQDEETGLLMLTQEAKRHSSEDRLQDFFVPEAATRRSYEIARGRRVRAGLYSFSVTLLEANSQRHGIQPRYSQIVVVRTGKDDWAIDKLP